MRLIQPPVPRSKTWPVRWNRSALCKDLRMRDPNWAEQLTAWSSLAMAAFSAVVAVFAYVAWRTARAALEASRLSSDAARASADAARAANEQTRLDGKAQTRPYVWVEIVPGMAGQRTFDLRIKNTGRSTARLLRLEFDSWPDPADDVASAVRDLFETPRTLPPGCSIRAMWRLEGNFTDGTTEAGLPKSGSIGVSYRGDDPDEPDYVETFDVMIERAGLWPVGETGPNPDGLPSDARKFYALGQALVRRVSELGR